MSSRILMREAPLDRTRLLIPHSASIVTMSRVLSSGACWIQDPAHLIHILFRYQLLLPS